jgi:hypothetical protein
MPNLQKLASQGIGRHGKAPHGSVRKGYAVDFLPAAAHVLEAHRSGSRSGHCPRAVAGEIVGLTAKEWRVM